MLNAGLYFILWMLGSAILGFLIAWVMRSSLISEWRNKFNSKSNDYNELDRKYKENLRLIPDLESNVKKLQTSSAKFREDADNYKSQYESIKSEHALCGSVSKNYDKLKGSYEELEVRFKGNESTINDLMSANKQLEEERAALQRKLNEKKEQKPAPVKVEKEKPAPAAIPDKAIKDYEDQLKTLRQRNDKLNLDYNDLNKSFDALNGSKKKVETDLESANAEIERLKGQMADLDKTSELESLKSQLNAIQLKHDESEKNYNSLQLTNGDLLKDIGMLKAQAANTNGGDEFKAKYEACQEEVARLKKEMETPAPVATPPPPPAKDADPKKQEVLNRIREKAKNIDFGRIGTANETEKDDLQEIKGIGPFLENKLNALGIYSFRQIANFNDDDDEKVNDAIEFFPGRVKRDDWKGQAKELFEKKKNG